MCNRKVSSLCRLLLILLIIILVLPIGASASTGEFSQFRASEFLSAYSAYIYASGNGKIEVWFDVQGTGYMDELGTLTIQVYECPTNSTNIDDWTWKETFKYDSTSGMLSYNDYFHSGYVDYTGTTGRWYKAYVCVWAGKNGDGDTRYFWTSAKKAT